MYSSATFETIQNAQYATTLFVRHQHLLLIQSNTVCSYFDSGIDFYIVRIRAFCSQCLSEEL